MDAFSHAQAMARRRHADAPSAKAPRGIWIQSGWLEGHPIRKARNAGQCDFWRGALHGGCCKTMIKPGDYYAEGERNDDAGGFGRDRYCMECAGVEARAALAKAQR